MDSQPSVPSLRPVLSGAAASASLAITGLALPALADTAEKTTGGERPAAVELDPILVEGATGRANTNAQSTRISRLPATLKETPKTVNAVPKQVIEEQRATTLEQALRNVPGITLSTGEGGGGQNGSQFRIRGLQARQDIYVDGLRDFGVYARDTFNLEGVQVLKGPSGDSFGAGGTGGLINQTSKSAVLDDFLHVDQSFGNGPLFRTTVDANRKVNDSTAFRVGGVFHRQNVVDRDHIDAERAGIAIDLGLGLGTETEWHLNYSYLRGDGIPDYGQPMVEGADRILRPAAEYGFDPSISYARSVNRDITNNHALSSYLTREANDWLTLSNDTRLTIYDRDFHGTPAGSCTVANGCAANFFSGNRAATYSLGAGGGLTYLQEGAAVQSISNAHLEVETGPFRHKANLGFDVSYQTDRRTNGSWPTWPNRGTASLFQPVYSYGFSPVYDTAGARSFDTINLGLYANDRLYFTDELSVLAGLRFSHFRTDLSSAAAAGSRTDNLWDPSVSVIWEPTPDYSVYASFSQSSKPITTDIAALASETVTTPISPEVSRSFEIGTKADFLDGRLGLTAALFQVDKDNAVNEDTQLPSGSGDASTSRRVRGAELGVTGKVTDAWSLFASYAYLDGEITSSATAAQIGKTAPYVPNHNFNVWTSYVVAEELSNDLPGKITVGAGLQYASSYFVDNAETQKIPDTFSVDAMISYEDEDFRVALNGYNLTDHQNYQSAQGGRAVPASGMTWLLSVGSSF